MSDELENVDAGSETSGEQAAETSQEDTAAETTEVSEETTADAGGAAEQNEQTSSDSSDQAPVDSDESRTGFVKSSARTGDACTCPDGRPGTVTVFAGNLAVCLPNHQG